MRPKQVYFLLIGLIVIATIGSLSAFILMRQNLGSKITRLRRTTADIMVENERISQLGTLQKEYQEIEPLAAKVNEIIPKEKQQAEVVAQISTIVRNVGLGLQSISFDSTKGVPSDTSQTQKSSVNGLLVMPVKFQIVASYAQLQSLLKQFENQERYMQVKNLGITRGESGLTFDITLEVFVRS